MWFGRIGVWKNVEITYIFLVYFELYNHLLYYRSEFDWKSDSQFGTGGQKYFYTSRLECVNLKKFSTHKHISVCAYLLSVMMSSLICLC